MLIYQIPRNSLAWLLVAQAAVIAPHLPRLPGWLIAVWLFVVLWRIQVFRGVWAFPRALVKALLTITCGAGLLLGYSRLTGLEPMVGLLLVAFALKLLEMQRKRDALVVIYLGYFVAATHFLFDANLVRGLYGLLSIVLLTTALMGLHQSEGHRYPMRSFRLAGKLVLQCIPLMVLLFVVMPRLGSFWKVPIQQNAARTGVSDSMAPGDFSRLTRSGGLAFRVTFEGEIPPTRSLYWRGLVFSDFDGRRWTQADDALEGIDGAALNATAEIWRYREGRSVAWGNEEAAWKRLIDNRGSPLHYTVILEPTHQPWLYALATPEPHEDKIGLTRDFRLVYRGPVRHRLQYRVTSYLDHSTEADGLPAWRRRAELQLPWGANPETLHRAKQWMAQVGREPAAYIERVLDYYHQAFTYTLKPPLLGRHSVDEFLWQTRRGFCEHFASSFVVLMRAAGVPARVVVGYQGGEINPLENYLLVHQYDAHAWAEVWLEGQGWQRVDPTAAVAPQRVENSLRDALSEGESLLVNGPLSLERYRHIALLNVLRLRWDALNYRWHRWVLGYDTRLQADTLRRLLGEVNAWRMALFIVGVGGVILAFVAFNVLIRGRKPPPSAATRWYLRFTRKLARAGIARAPGEAPRDYARRVSRVRPELRAAVERITDLYEKLSYQLTRGRSRREAQASLRQAVRRFSARRKLFFEPTINTDKR